MIRLRTTLAAVLLAAMPVTSLADEDSGFAEFKLLRPKIALQLAEAALESCREGGYQVAVAVVDRFGQPQVILRDRFAGSHTIDTATGKAWTSVSFRAPTLELDGRIASGELSPGLRDIPDALFLGGGVPVLSAGSIVGGIGISGAPSPQIDQDCAEAGIDAISEVLDF